MFKGVEWHDHLIKVTEPLPLPHLLREQLHGQSRSGPIKTKLKLKQTNVKSSVEEDGSFSYLY